MTDFKTTHNDSLQQILAEFKTSLHLNQLEVGPLGQPITIQFYEKWLAENNHGSMNYLKEHLDMKKNPQILHAGLRTVISVAQSYFPAVEPTVEKNPARVAVYAQNNDYHYWLKEKLIKIVNGLAAHYPSEVFLPFVDSGPVLERNWAYQNSLGWFGKNTCILHPQHGSLFFVAEILTTLPYDVPAHLPLPDFCGTCRKCIDICPTQALIKPRELKADLCISYLTIESKSTPSIDLRSKMGDWFFGCDLCQTVCPWNEKVFRQNKISPTHETSTELKLNLSEIERAQLIDYFRWLLTASHKQIQKKVSGTALARPGAKGLKRNALIVIANRDLHELQPEVEKLKLEELIELKDWALDQLVNNKT